MAVEIKDGKKILVTPVSAEDNRESCSPLVPVKKEVAE